MTIGRYQFEVSVTGAPAAETALDRVGNAAESAGRKARDAGDTGLKRMEGALEAVTGPAGKALRIFNDVGDVFKLTAAGIAGGALFGGLQDIAEALKSIYEAARKAWNPELWDHMKVWEERAKALAKAEEEAKEAIVARIRAQESAGAGGLIKALDTLGGGADPAALDRVIELTRNLTELEQKRADIAAKSAQFGSAGAGESLIRIQQQIEFARKELRGYTEVGQNVGPSKSGPTLMEAIAPVVRPDPVVPLIDAALARGATSAPQEDAPDSPFVRLFGAIKDEAETVAMNVRSAMDEIVDGMKTAPSAVDAVAASFEGAADRMIAAATNMAGLVTQAVGTLTTAVGSMATNMIIAGDAGAKGVAKMAGNALAAASAQAYGYSVLLAFMAAAAAASGPILGWGAGGLLAGGGIMAGGATALAVMARALGADKIGGGARAAGGGGGGSASAAGTNPYQSQSQAPTQVTVIIGEEVVTRGVRVAERRQAMRGGISEAA